MTNPIRHLLFTGLLALSLVACDSSSSGDAAGSNSPGVNTSSDESLSLVQSRNAFTEAFCPLAASASDGTMDAMACESEGAQNASPATAEELARFCPSTAGDSAVSSAEFPLNCLSEADALFAQLAPIMGGLSPLAEQLCPATNGAGNSNPLDCFAEAIANASGQLPGSDSAELDGLPEFPAVDGLPESDGLPGADAFAQQICPRTAATGEFSRSTPFECLTEAGRNLQMASELLFQSNPLTELGCPRNSIANPVDPVACFIEAAGTFVPSDIAQFNQIPGLAGFDGIPGIDRLREFADLADNAATEGFQNIPGFAQACGSASNPLTCLLAVGDRFAQVRGLLVEDNPLVQAICPDNTLDPVGCFTAAFSGFADFIPGDGAPEFDGLPGLDRLTALPDEFAGGGDALPGLDGLTELAELLNGGGDSNGLPLLGSLPVLGDLLSGGGDDLPGLDSLTQLTDLLGGADDLPGLDSLTGLADLISGGGDFDFPGAGSPDLDLDGLAQLAELLSGDNPELPGLDSLTTLLTLLGGGDDVGIPGGDSLPGVAELCGANSEPFSCLLGAGERFGTIQDLLSDDMIAGSVCPLAGADDPAACFTELLGSLGNLAEGDLPLVGDLLGTLAALQP